MRLLLAFLAACNTLTPADRADIATAASVIEGCEEAGRMCKVDGGHDCYGVYDACMRDAGLH